MSTERKAPGKPAAKKVRRSEVVLLVFTVASILAIFTLFFLVNASSKVWLVNALDVPVDVVVDGAKVPVPAGSKVDVRLRAGIRAVRVESRSGEILEEGLFDVRGGYNVVVYNVLGAAPLYQAEISYGSRSGTPPEPEFLGGQRAVNRDHVDFVFVEPPSTISVQSGDRGIRKHFDLLQGGWKTTVSFLGMKDPRSSVMAELCRAVARAQPEDPQANECARQLAQSLLGIDGQLRLLRGAMERRPDDVEALLSYASVMRQAGRGDEVRAAYRPRFTADPKNVALGSVLVRVEPFEEAQAIAAALLESDPKSEIARKNAAHLACSTEDWARCVEIYASLAGTARGHRGLDVHARALVALKRTPEALELVARELAASATPDLTTSLLYARIAALPGAGAPPVPPSTYIEQATSKSSDLQIWAKLQLGGSVRDAEIAAVKSEQDRRIFEIQRDAAKDPGEAWRRCSSADPAVLSRLSSTTALLLGAEFARAGDPELGDRLLEGHTEYGLPRSALFEYALLGKESPDLWRLDPEWRAALDLVRARRLEERRQPADAAYQAAERRDLLRDLVTRARNNWPPIKRSAAGSVSGGVVGGVIGTGSKAPRRGAGLTLQGSSSEVVPRPPVVFTKDG